MMFEDYLVSNNHTVINSDDQRQGKNLYWDLEIENGTRFEIKYDQKAWVYYHMKEHQHCQTFSLNTGQRQGVRSVAYTLRLERQTSSSIS